MHHLTEIKVMKLKADQIAYVEDGKGKQKKQVDRCRTGFLASLVYFGMTVDLLNVFLLYGVAPKLDNMSNKAKKRVKQLVWLLERTDKRERTGEPPNGQEVTLLKAMNEHMRYSCPEPEAPRYTHHYDDDSSEDDDLQKEYDKLN